MRQLDAADPADVGVGFPRFEMTNTVRLDAVLRAMGIESAFSRAADHSRMAPEGQLYWSAAYQRAYMRADETGVEAAAVTVVNTVESDRAVACL